MKDLTPVQQLGAKYVGSVGTVIGLIFASIMTVYYKKLWWWGIFLGFLVFLQVVQLIGVRQQYNNTKRIYGEVQGYKIDQKLGNIGGK